MEHPGGMKRFRLPLLIFLLVFLCGTMVLLYARMETRKFRPAVPRRRTERIRDTMAPLTLPRSVRAVKPSGDSWEYRGETGMNFVTSKAQFVSAFLHQSWKLEREIPLEESVAPKLLLTFTRGDIELIVMLWKLDTGNSGFAYRREKIIKPGVTLK